jgi:hypothetical protein
MNDLNNQMQEIIPDENKVVPSELSFYFTDEMLIRESHALEGKVPVGYETADGYDGVKPVRIDTTKDWNSRLLQLYNYRENPPEGFSATQLDEQVSELFDTNRQYYEQDGTLVTVPNDEWRIWTATKRLVDPLSKVIPGWQGVSETEREFEFSQELADAKLSKEDQQKIFQSTEGWFPEEGDVPFLLQIQNLGGNLYDFFPDIAGAGIWAWQKATEKKADLKALENQEITFDEYTQQEHVAAIKNLEKTRYWEDLRSRIPLIAPYKNLFKAVVFNSTEDKFGEGIKLTDEQMNLLFKEGPLTYQVARIASEAIPYVIAIESVLFKGFGMIRGTKAYDDALEYVSKNTHKHGSPYEALVKYMEQDAIKKTWIDTKKGKRFMNSVVKRYDKTSKRMTKIEKSALEKEASIIEKRIIEADRTGDVVKMRSLIKQKEMLVTQIAGLKVKWLNNYTTAVVRNEAYASSIGGTIYSITGSDGLALGGELTGAILEPNIHSSLKNLSSAAIFRVAQLVDGLDTLSLVPEGAKIWTDKNLKSKFFTGDVKDLMIRDKKSGEIRALTVKEIGKLRGFAEMLEILPIKDRHKILARMQKSQEVLENLKKGLPEEQHKDLNMTIAEMTGLSVLNAIDELTNINIKITNIRPDDIIKANDNMNQSLALMDSIDRRMQQLLGSTKNPSDELFKFGTNIEQNLEKMRLDLEDRKEAFDQVIKIYSDSLNGISIADNPDALHLKFEASIRLLEELKNNGITDSIKQTATEQLEMMDKKILAHWEAVAKDLNGFSGNYVKGYTVQDYFASQYYTGMTLIYSKRVSSAYDKLDDLTKGQTIDVTDSYQAISSIIERNLGDKIGDLANKLPPGHFNNKMMNILEQGADDSLNKFLTTDDTSRVAFASFMENAPEQTEEMVQAMDILVNKQGNLTQGNINTIFNAISDTLSQTQKYKNIGSDAITKLDIYDAFREANIPIAINLKVSDAMDLRSSLTTLKSKAFLADQKIQSLNYDNMVSQIEKSVSDSLVDKEQMDAFNEALNLARDFHVRFDNKDSLLFTWGQFSGAPLSARITSNLQDGSTVLDRKKLTNSNIEKLKKDLRIDSKTDVPIYKHKLEKGEFIPWKKLLNDPIYAEKWMRDVAEPLVGRPVKQGDNILPNQTHIIDMSDADVAQRAQIFKKLLQQELGSYMSLSKTGQDLMDFSTRNEILKLAREKKIEIPIDIKVSNDVDRLFKITDDFNLLDINLVQETNFGYETARALSRAVQEYDKQITRAIKRDLTIARKTTAKELRKIRFQIENLGSQRLIARFGSDLSDPQKFYKAVIEGNNIANYKALEIALTEGPYKVMSKSDFKEVARTLYREWFNKFSNIRILRPEKAQFEMVSKVDEVHGTVNKSRQALAEAESKIRNVYETNLGLGIDELTKNKEVLYELFGKGVDNVTEILQTMAAKSGINIDNINLQNMPKALSVESWISRIYSINRGVISPRYVLTEAALQKYRVQNTSMLIDLMSQPEAANIVQKLMTDGLAKSPYLDVRLRKFFQSRTVNAILANEILSEEGKLNFNNAGSLIGKESVAGTLIRWPFTPEKEVQQRL